MTDSPSLAPAAGLLGPTQEQLEVRRFLLQNAAGAAQAYDAALYLRQAPEFPGRPQLLAHALRDLVNRLPEAILRPETDERQEASTALNMLRTRWLEWLDQNAPVSGEAPSLQPYDAFYRVLDQTLRAWGTGDKNKRDLARRMFEAWLPAGRNDAASLEPITEAWLEIGTWAVKETHFDGAEARSTPWSECERMLRRLEDILRSAHSAFFDVARELDEILDQANS